MNELISGKEALIALANGKEVLFRNKSTGDTNHAKYQIAECIQNGYYEYRGKRIYLEFFIKPRTITLNGIEVPAPFEPRTNASREESYVITLGGEKFYWKDSDEYSQVVSALREVFK